MTVFDKLAEDLITFTGYKIDYCSSDNESIEKSGMWLEGMPYPVHFSSSDTSGEIVFEEFYTSGEAVDMNRFSVSE